jgi:hypothetical protein
MVRIKSFTIDKLGDASGGMEWIHLITTTNTSTNYMNTRCIDPGEGMTGSSHYAIEMEYGGKEFLVAAVGSFLQDNGYNVSLMHATQLNHINLLFKSPLRIYRA